MECALVRGRVAEEADADLIRLAQLYGQSRAAANALPCADDAVRAEDALVSVRDMHGTALAVAIAGRTAEELRHHKAHVSALGDYMAVAAVRAGDIVFIRKAFAHARSEERR